MFNYLKKKNMKGLFIMLITNKMKKEIKERIGKITWLNEETIENFEDTYNIIFCIEVLRKCVKDEDRKNEIEELLTEVYEEQIIEK